MKLRRRQFLQVLGAAALAGVAAGCAPGKVPAAAPASRAASAAAPGEKTAAAGWKVIAASDLHYLSPALTDYGAAFSAGEAGGDGKTLHWMPQVLAAFVRQAAAEAPDAVILSGDLTFNGAAESHRDLAAALAPLTAAGVPVYVMPGNHDIGGMAYQYQGGGVLARAAADAAFFEQNYHACGFDGALSRDAATLSYSASPAPGLRLLLLDGSGPDAYGKTDAGGGALPESTLAWAKGEIAAAAAAGEYLLPVSHQNLLAHVKLFGDSYRLPQAAALRALYPEGVRVHLSGHIHSQHVGTDGGVTEIVASALGIAPCQYGVLTADAAGALAYETRPVDVAAWARAAGETAPELLDFAAYIRTFFDTVTAARLQKTVSAAPEADRTALTALAVQMNGDAYAGTLTAVSDPAALALWQRDLPDAFFTAYLTAHAAGPLADQTRWQG